MNSPNGNPHTARLLYLHRRLTYRRAELLRRLKADLSELQGASDEELSSDSLDAAFESTTGDLASQFAEMDARELANVERALERLRSGQYGMCELCGRKIAVARLNALPHTATCIRCMSELERGSDMHGQVASSSEDRVTDKLQGTSGITSATDVPMSRRLRSRPATA